MVLKIVTICLVFCIITVPPLASQTNIQIIEEPRDFWNKLIQTINIDNKNLLYASYIAYKDKLFDLSIDTFQECVSQNVDNQLIQGIANYYIAKNFFHMSDYKKAALYFLAAERYSLEEYTYIKAAALINASICYLALNDTTMAKTYLLRSKDYDTEGRYNTTFDLILQSIK